MKAKTVTVSQFKITCYNFEHGKKGFDRCQTFATVCGKNNMGRRRRIPFSSSICSRSTFEAAISCNSFTGGTSAWAAYNNVYINNLFHQFVRTCFELGSHKTYRLVSWFIDKIQSCSVVLPLYSSLPNSTP